MDENHRICTSGEKNLCLIQIINKKVNIMLKIKQYNAAYGAAISASSTITTGDHPANAIIVGYNNYWMSNLGPKEYL